VAGGEAQSIRELLVRAERLAREGRLADADLASAEALQLTRGVAAASLRSEVIAGLCRIYLEAVPVRWSEAYTFPDASLIRFREACDGGRRVVEALVNAADPESSLEPADALRCLLAAANVTALFGDTGLARRSILRKIWELASEMHALDDALAAAMLERELIPELDDDEIELAEARSRVGRTLLALGRAPEAVTLFDQALRTWREIDRERGRPPSRVTLEAEMWVTKARLASEGASIDDTLATWMAEADAARAAGDTDAVMGMLAKTAMLALECSRPAEALRAARALAGEISETTSARVRLSVEEWMGRALLDTGRPAEAVEHLRAALLLACDLQRDKACRPAVRRYAELVEAAQAALANSRVRR
jgi:tetratricopeptide (TPR) repeat protein